MFLPTPNYCNHTSPDDKYKTLDGVITDTITMEDHQGEILLKPSED
jgi:hypothetical protein